jgi:hypothetical protein
MPRADASIKAPWWWSAVAGDVAPSIAAHAASLGLSVDATTQRVWAALGLIVDQHFSIETLAVLFPEVDLTGVSRWKVGETFTAVLAGSRETVITHAALDSLATAARDAHLPPPPVTAAKRRGKVADWRSVLSRSTLGGDIFFVRGTHRSHAGMGSYKKKQAHPYFSAIWNTCNRFGFVRTEFATGGPANASSYENYSAFLDGGLMSRAGDYLLGLHGAWIFGHVALRFLCLQLHLTTPPWPREAGQAPARTELARQSMIQLATELPKLQQRLKQLQYFRH